MSVPGCPKSDVWGGRSPGLMSQTPVKTLPRNILATLRVVEICKKDTLTCKVPEAKSKIK